MSSSEGDHDGYNMVYNIWYQYYEWDCLGCNSRQETHLKEFSIYECRPEENECDRKIKQDYL